MLWWDRQKRLGAEHRNEDQLTLELYASGEDEEMDSSEASHRREEVEVDLQSCLERRGQDSTLVCCQPSSTSQLRDP